MSDQKPRTINEQLQLLKARGMNFANEERARVCLSHISYFRLKYYWKDMVDTDSEDEDFLESARFEDVPYARLGFTGDWRKEPLWR